MIWKKHQNWSAIFEYYALAADLKNLLSAIFVAIIASACLISLPGQALPTETDYTAGDLVEMARFSGKYSVAMGGYSVDGAGTSGNITISKPAGGTSVKAAYAFLTKRGLVETTPLTPQATINTGTITFTHTARSGEDMFLENYFADVADLLQSTLTSASAGNVVAPFAYRTEMKGLAHTVIFNDSTQSDGTVIMQFGHADMAGDSSTHTFPALTTLSTMVMLSLGIGWSLQNTSYATNTEGYSSITLSTSSNSTPQTISNYAGGHDDGQLMTVGGYDDSTAKPSGAWVNYSSDDELCVL